MASAIQDVPDQEFNGIRYTGFPEPLSLRRNTTLPHPDANLSPDACIESFGNHLARSSSRHRFSSSRRRVSSKGFIDPTQVYEDIHYVDSTVAVVSKPGSSSSKESTSPSDGDGGFKSREEGGRSSGETDSSERNHRKKKGLRGLFHKG
ncbi:hypothetical protein VC83_06153 [Pseudogymnoascus destructans]|uniref:Uncharacterized protein n=2 Tax=Pseudogymnoascus destructans TaxID=655981 RepID=L8G3U7_PSED2|nr:uncharacterized protein VC83_06153 [Pseudogymnoascus destructans]ELR07343.1 hypothetical protein GMDG_02523 [Pseudogymnoascus destructans 20631-21]OAF58998.1 hypothetical protein VC83_06153 [Pseudogymnoascus destructans]